MVGLLKTRKQLVSVWATGLRVAFFLLLLSTGFAHSATADVPPLNRPELSIARAPQFAIGDFDGDNRPDLASVEFGWNGTRKYAINFRLTSGPPQSIDIAAPEGGLRLRTRDVNGDNFPDVVVTTLWTDRPVAVLLNDGRGNFTRSEPSAFPDAFRKSENSFAAGDDSRADAVAALFSRYSPEPCENHGSAGSPLSAVGHAAIERFHFVSRPICNSSFGRAPPSSAIHS
jgi:VCBS repeat protein